MLEFQEIDRIVNRAATMALKKVRLNRVFSESAIDSYGHDALRVTVVLEDPDVRKVDGDAVLDTFARIQRDLLDAGEERFPIVDFATKLEIEQDGDTES